MTTELDAALRLKLVDEVTATARQIADQFGVVGAEALAGSGVASGAFEELKVRELGAREEARRLSAELRALKASGAGTEEEIRELSVELVRAKEAARQYAASARDVQRAHAQVSGSASGAGRAMARTADSQARAAARSAMATQGASRSLELVSTQSKNAGREMGGLVNVVAEMGYSFGSAIPGMQGAGMQMAMMGGSAYQLGAAFGPVGVGIGVLTGVLPLLISQMSDTRAETDAAAEAQDRFTRSVLDTVDAIQQQRRANQREDTLEEGGASAEEQASFLEAREGALRSAETAERGFRANLSRAARERLEAVEAAGAESAEEIREVLLDQIRERNNGELTPNAMGIVNQQLGSVMSDLRGAQQLEQVRQTQEAARNRARAALETAQEREREEAIREGLEGRAGASSERLSALFDAQGLTGRRDRALREAVEGGNLERATRLVGSDQARELLSAQDASRQAALALAQYRVGALEEEARPTLLDERVEGAAAPEPVIERVRRRVRDVEPAGRAPAEPPDTTFLARFADDLDRARLRVIVEDARTKTVIEGGGLRAPIEVDTVSSDLTGGQQ